MRFKVEYLGDDRLFDCVHEAVKFADENSKNGVELEVKPIEGCTYTQEELAILYFGLQNVLVC